MGSDVPVGGVVKGFVKGFKSLISPTIQTQQQTVTSPIQTQQPSISLTSNAGALTTASPTMMVSPATSNQVSPGTFPHPYSLPSPTIADTSNQKNNNQLGPFNGAYHISPAPIQRSLSGSSVPQILKNTNPDPPQMTQSVMWNGTSLPSYSAGDLDYTSEPDDPNTDAIPGSYLDREPSENGDGGDETDEVLIGNADVQSLESFVYPPSVSSAGSIGTCKLKGCSNPTFVDSITDLESEYCSRKHQE